MSNTRRDARNFLLMSGTVTVLDAIRNIITANMLGPYMTGLCTTLLVIPQIAQYFNLGLTDALTVAIPAERGKNRPEIAAALKNSVLKLTLLISGVSVLFVLFYILLIPSTREMNLYIFAAGLLIVFWQTKKYFVSVYAAENRFTKLSLIELSFSLMVTASQIILVYYFSGYGFWLGFIIPNILILAYFGRDYLKEALWRFGAAVRESARIVPLGISMMISAVTYAPFLILSRIFLAKTAGMEEVGFFLLGMLILPKISIVPAAISKVITPKMSLLHAETNSYRPSYRLYRKAQIYTFSAVGLMVAGGWFLIQPATALIMPKYVDGVASAQMMLLAGIPYCLIDNANNFLLAHHYKRAYIRNLTVAVLLQLLSFGGLVVLGDVSAYNVNIALILVFTVYAFLSNRKVIRICG